MPALRLRVANVRFLLLSLLAVVGILVWLAWSSPAERASGGPTHSDLTIIGYAGDAGHGQVGDPSRVEEAATQGEPAEEHARQLADAETLLALIEAERQPGERDERTDALEIRALVSLTRIGAAHAKLQHFAEHYPTSSELPALVRLTGYHPRPRDRHAR